ALLTNTICRWYTESESGDESLANDERGRPQIAVNDVALRTLVESNPRQTVRELVAVFGVSAMTISCHLQ
ncbi:hypothetical protein Angca_000099, partial [Angiostrongylus cantonensis]